MKPVLLTLALLALAACQVRRGAASPPLDVTAPALPSAFSSTGDVLCGGRWWRAFGDPGLDLLVEEALAGNPGLQALGERMLRAAALARREAAALRPTLDASAGAGATAAGSDVGGRRTTDVDEAFSLGGAAAYELDLWGRLGALRDAAVWEARATEGDLDAARLGVVAAVAEAWFGLVAEARTGALLEEQGESNEQLLALLEARFQQGKIGAPDVLRQQQLAEATRGARVESLAREATWRHQLATLRGRAPPADVPALPAALPEPPPLPATGTPGDVLRRRPDVAAAWRRVLAADRDLAAALADRYPRIRFGAEGLLGGGGLTLLFQDWLLRLAGELTAPLADGGRRRAQVAADAALRRERLHRYGEALLAAVKDVEDALVQERHARAVHASLERQLELARRIADVLLDRYGQGTAAYLEVLTALTAQQGLARSVVAARRRILDHRIALCRALAGPWSEGPCGAARDPAVPTLD